MGRQRETEFDSCYFSVHWVEFGIFGLDGTLCAYLGACVCWARFDIRHTYRRLIRAREEN
jgi:hypothetical protein